MGQTLSTPNTEKHIKDGGDDRFIYALCEMQGWRVSMEDAHAIELNLDEDDDDDEDTNTFFAVYDGHGGSAVAKYSGEHVHQRLVSEDAYQEGNYAVALKRAFLGTDEDLRADPQFSNEPSGCTAVAALVTHDKRIFVANAGDSRSVLSVKGVVKPLSFDHKPVNPSEQERIVSAGGFVEFGRVNGNLALSRAIGDFEFKKKAWLAPERQIVTSDPDITVHPMTEEDEFLVLACDGIWDCLTSQQVVDIIRLQISQRKELNDIAESLCDLCLAPDTNFDAGKGCDNMTVLIIGLLNGRTKEQWYDWIADRVQNKYGYDTPPEVPQIYPPARIRAYHEHRRRYDEARQSRNGYGGRAPGTLDLADDESYEPYGRRAFGLARSLLSGGISFHPGTGIISRDGTIMFPKDEDDSGEEDMNIEHDNGTSSFLAALGLDPLPLGSSDVTKSLKAQLEELEDDDLTSRFEVLKDEEDAEGSRARIEESEDEDQVMSDSDDEAQQAFGAYGSPNISASLSERVPKPSTTSSADDSRQGEAPPSPSAVPNGKLKQLNSSPGGDEAPPVVQAEGLMDVSESPLKG